MSSPIRPILRLAQEQADLNRDIMSFEEIVADPETASGVSPFTETGFAATSLD